MIIIPLNPTLANQTLRITLNNQVCTITVRQLGAWLFLTLALPTGPLLTNRMCLNRVLLVRQPYLGFVGDLAFVDLQGKQDPVYSGLYTPGNAGRYALVYLAPGEY